MKRSMCIIFALTSDYGELLHPEDCSKSNPNDVDNKFSFMRNSRKPAEKLLDIRYFLVAAFLWPNFVQIIFCSISIVDFFFHYSNFVDESLPLSSFNLVRSCKQKKRKKNNSRDGRSIAKIKYWNIFICYQWMKLKAYIYARQHKTNTILYSNGDERTQIFSFYCMYA